MEEFHANDVFVEWFCSLIGINDARGDGAWHSVADVDGESDMILRIVQRGRHIGIFIENKIAAREMDAQAERYHVRAARAREEGKLDDYVTVMCAPRHYLAGLDPISIYQYKISYESIAEWFRGQADRRSLWRADVLQCAIDHNRRGGYSGIPHEAHTLFHFAYWEYVCANFPKIKMAKPTVRHKQSHWIVLKGPEVTFPKTEAQVDHLLDHGIVRLSLYGRTVKDVQALRPDWPDDVEWVQKKGSACLCVTVPPVELGEPFDGQLEAIDRALQAAGRLLPYAIPVITALGVRPKKLP